MVRLLVLATILFSSVAHAGMKEDFVEAVKKQCSLDQAKSEELATPGRTGNVIKFSVCAETPVDLGNGCKVSCTKSGSTIGG